MWNGNTWVPQRKVKQYAIRAVRRLGGQAVSLKTEEEWDEVWRG